MTSTAQDLLMPVLLGGTCRDRRRLYRVGWDPGYNPVSSEDALGRRTTGTYDARGNLTTSVDAKGGTATLSYDPVLSHVTHVTNQNGDQTDYAYDPAGHCVTTTVYVAAIPDLGESATRYITYRTYDNRGLLLKVVDPRGDVTEYSYNGTGQLTGTDQRLETSPGVFDHLVTKYEVDGWGRRTAMVDPRGVRTEYVYDLEGRLVETRFAVAPDGTYQSHTTNEYYPFLGLLKKTTDATGRYVAYTYTERDQVATVSDGEGLRTKSDYDPAGNLVAVTDGNGNTTLYKYNAACLLSEVVDAEGGHVYLHYDTLGNLKTVTDPNQHVTTYDYDELNRRIKVTHPGIVDDQMDYETMDYDAVGNMTKRVVGGLETDFLYDSLRRLRRKKAPADPNTPEVDFRYDAVGNRTYAATTVPGAGGSSPYVVTSTFDSVNRLVEEAIGGLATKRYEHDPAGHVTRMTVTPATTSTILLDIVYAYNDLSQMVSLTSDGHMTTYAYEAGSCASCGGGGGNLTSITRPNGIVTNMTYDRASQVTRIKHNRGNGPALSYFFYTYDPARNRATMRDITGMWTYSYDQLNRLTKASATIWPELGYEYDAGGNRVGATNPMSFAAPEVYGYNADDELTDVIGGSDAATTIHYEWDSRGNLAARTVEAGAGVGLACTFDGWERLTKAVSPSATKYFGYDSSGERVEEVTGEGSGATRRWFIYEGLNVVMELNGAGWPTAVVVPGLSKTRLDLPEPFTEFFLHDALGSVAELTDSQGNLTQEYWYEPFGNAEYAPRRDPHNRYRFVGLQQDDDLGLIYMNARWYDPAVGRFVSRDPRRPSIVGTQDINAYAYVKNAPVGHSDLTGEGEQCGSGISGIIIPDAVIGTYDFSWPCELHDKCYDTLGAKKADCDVALLSDCKFTCRDKGKETTALCEKAADLFYVGVNELGQAAYDAAQKAAKDRDDQTKGAPSSSGNPSTFGPGSMAEP